MTQNNKWNWQERENFQRIMGGVRNVETPASKLGHMLADSVEAKIPSKDEISTSNIPKQS